MTTQEQLLAKLERLLEDGSLPKSGCSSALLQALQPLLETGVVTDERRGTGRRLFVRNAPALEQFITDRFPRAAASEADSARVTAVGRFRDSKALPNDVPEIVELRAWGNVLFRHGQALDAVTATRQHGLLAFLLSHPQDYTLRGSCALIENPAVFTQTERLELGCETAILARGCCSNRLLEWLGLQAESRLLHLPDYDPAGLTEYTRLRAALGERVRLHLPPGLPERFARYSNRLLLSHPRSQVLLAKLRESNLPEVREVMELIQRHNAGLEQEALLLPTL